MRIIYHDNETWPCSGDPYSCKCPTCQEWLIDVLADRAFDEARDEKNWPDAK